MIQNLSEMVKLRSRKVALIRNFYLDKFRHQKITKNYSINGIKNDKK